MNLIDFSQMNYRKVFNNIYSYGRYRNVLRESRFNESRGMVEPCRGGSASSRYSLFLVPSVRRGAWRVFPLITY